MTDEFREAAEIEANTPIAVPGVDRNMALKDVTPIQGFKFMSGNIGSCHNHPCIFAHANNDGEDELMILGDGIEATFPLNRIEAAFEKFKLALKMNKYR